MKEVTKGSDGKLCVQTHEGASVPDVECLLWAVGRTPATADLGLKDTGVEVDEKGRVKVDDFQNTTARNVYALGDVTGKWELTPGRKRPKFRKGQCTKGFIFFLLPLFFFLMYAKIRSGHQRW